MDTSRTELLLNIEGVNTLSSKKVTIVGVGGVGGYAAMMLARAGLGEITIVDFDRVSTSNINRQVVANVNTVGLLKVDVLGKMMKEINPDLKLKVVAEKLTEENVAEIISYCDMCIDAIDSVKDKIALIVHCKKNNIPIISAMGAGNRYDVPYFYLTDIYKTHDDGLAKVVRKKLRSEGIEGVDVVTTDSKPLQNKSGVVGSISYYPAMCGITISAVVINKLLGVLNTNK